tara:strand:- start:448 stop:1344 length:897 start_codon:yes stop_codon:yes gene_type:complete
MKAILIFGGTGFLGNNLVKFLLKKNLKIIVYKHKNMGVFLNKHFNNLIYINSLNKKILKKYEIQTIFHLATKTFNLSEKFEDFYKTNILLTKNIIELAKYLKINQFIYISTGSVFSKKTHSGIFDESSIPTPNSYYGLFKYMTEKLIEIELKKTQIKNCIIRFPSIFGINNNVGIVNEFYNLAKHNKPIKVFNNGQKLRNLIHVSSAVEILYLIYKKKSKLSKHEIFMAGSKEELKLLDIVRLLIRFTKSRSKVILIKKSSPSDFDVKISNLKAKKLLGFKPLSIKAGLKKYIKEYEK